MCQSAITGSNYLCESGRNSGLGSVAVHILCPWTSHLTSWISIFESENTNTVSVLATSKGNCKDNYNHVWEKT